MRVSEASPTQILEIVDILLEMHKECPLPLGAPDRAKIANGLASCTKFLALDGDNYIAGILALREGPWWFSKEHFIGDLVFYVRPSHRASKAATLLLKRAKEYAKIKGLPLMMAVVSGVDVDRKDQFFARQNFKKVGGAYMYKE